MLFVAGGGAEAVLGRRKTQPRAWGEVVDKDTMRCCTWVVGGKLFPSLTLVLQQLTTMQH